MQFSLPALLGVAFIVLKLCHVIAWSWLWVLAPIWIVAAIGLLFLLFILVLWIWANDKSI